MKSSCVFQRILNARWKQRLSVCLIWKSYQEIQSIWVTPFFVGWNNFEAFNDIFSRMERKLQRWKAKLDSQAGRCILLNNFSMLPLFMRSQLARSPSHGVAKLTVCLKSSSRLMVLWRISFGLMFRGAEYYAPSLAVVLVWGYWILLVRWFCIE